MVKTFFIMWHNRERCDVRQVQVEEHKPPPSLHLAAASGDTAAVAELLAGDASSLGERDSEMMTALMAAIRFHRADVVTARA